MAHIIGVCFKEKLGKYLVVDIDFAQKKELFESIIQRVENKLQGWKYALLSQAGRLTFIKSVS